MPPYSDNLYSADDTPPHNDGDGDAHSFTEELSPTDGYFSRREDMPSNVYVPDPTVDRKDTEDKVLIPGQTPGGARHSRQPDSASRSGETSQSNTNSRHRPASHLYPSIAFASPPPSSNTDAYASSSNTESTPTPSTNTQAPSSRIAHPRTNTSYSETTPLMSAPPPAYSPSPISPTSPQSQQGRTCNTFSPVPPSQLPESMGRPEEPSERDSLTAGNYLEQLRRRDQKRGSPRRERVRKFLLLALLIVVFITFMTTSWNISFTRGDKHHADTPSDDNPSDGSPSPPKDGPSGNYGKTYCSAATTQTSLEFLSFEGDFGSGQDLNIIQEAYEEDHRDRYSTSSVQTSGAIHLRRLPEENKEAYFQIDVRVSHPEIHVRRGWDHDSHTLKVSTPEYIVSDSPNEFHCVSVEVTVWLPENAEIGKLLVQSITLGLNFWEDAKISTTDVATFETLTGHISFPTFSYTTTPSNSADILPPAFLKPYYELNSRRLEIRTASGSISGLFPLYDYLHFYSISGTIKAGIVPHSIDSNAPAAAELIASTSSSTISLNLPIVGANGSPFSPPPRDYVTTIQTHSGSVSGTFYQGSSTRIETTSSSIKATFLPVIEADRAVSLYTKTLSGSTNVIVLDPIYISLLKTLPASSTSPNEGKQPSHDIGNNDPYLLLPPTSSSNTNTNTKSRAFRTLTSTHKSTSGSLAIAYPPTWEGLFTAYAMSGSIKVSGDGVHVIKDRKGYDKHEVVARKGDAGGVESESTVASLSGSIKFGVGENSSGKGNWDWEW